MLRAKTLNRLTASDTKDGQPSSRSYAEEWKQH